MVVVWTPNTFVAAEGALSLAHPSVQGCSECHDTVAQSGMSKRRRSMSRDDEEEDGTEKFVPVRLSSVQYGSNGSKKDTPFLHASFNGQQKPTGTCKLRKQM